MYLKKQYPSLTEQKQHTGKKNYMKDRRNTGEEYISCGL
jgi:hypothetical protein